MTVNPNQGKQAAAGPVVTKGELAAALKVSVRTIERLVSVGDLRPLGGRGWLVRFYLPDVVAVLQRVDRKFGRRAALPAGGVAGVECRVTRAEGGHLTRPSPQRGEGAAARRLKEERAR